MVVRVDEAVWLVAMNEKSVTVPCSADVDLENGKGMCKARKGRGRSKDELLFRQRDESIIHS